jgi:hypothetical protein
MARPCYVPYALDHVANPPTLDVTGACVSDSSKHRKESLHDHQAAPVSLRVAASLVYFEIKTKGSLRGDGELDRALDDAALALAQISSIYYTDDAGHLMPIPETDLASGHFQSGAKSLKAADGTVYRSLSMRRIDVMRAVEVLKKASFALKAMETTIPPVTDPAGGADPSK